MASEPSGGAAQPPGAPKLGFLRAIEPTGTTRVETLSDGVFAVAMTLLILDVRLPLMSQRISAGAIFRSSVWTVAEACHLRLQFRRSQSGLDHSSLSVSSPEGLRPNVTVLEFPRFDFRELLAAIHFARGTVPTLFAFRRNLRGELAGDAPGLPRFVAPRFTPGLLDERRPRSCHPEISPSAVQCLFLLSDGGARGFLLQQLCEHRLDCGV